MPYAVRSIFLWPSDHPPVYDARKASRIVAAGQVACRALWLTQTGWTFDIHHQLLRTPVTRAQLGGHQEGANYNEQRDEHGKGLHTTSVHEAIAAVLPASETKTAPNVHRWSAVVANGGLYAGGNHDNPSHAGGYSIFGDCFVHLEATGQPDPECLNHYGADFCTLANGTPWWDGLFHEQGHMFNLHHDMGNVDWKAQLTPEQLARFGESNKAFIYRPEGSSRRVWTFEG